MLKASLFELFSVLDTTLAVPAEFLFKGFLSAGDKYPCWTWLSHVSDLWVIRQFKQRRFWATHVNQKWTFLPSWAVILNKLLGKSSP